MSRHQYLDPQVLARIRDLRLIARTAIEGSTHGIHTSRQHGAGLEFNQYRQYEYGDDPRQIDWRLYARSDRVFVRQSERESQLTVWFVVDSSASMAQPSGQIHHWSRLDYAKSLVACLAYAVHAQGDACGLVGINANELCFLPARDVSRHLDAVLAALENLSGTGGWPRESKLSGLWERVNKPGLTVVVSDFFQHSSEIERLVGKLNAAGQELITLQLLTRDEQTFPYTGTVEFVDRETGERVRSDAAACRATYLQRFQAQLDALSKAMARIGVSHERVTIEAPLDQPLWRILNHRLVADARHPRRSA